VRYGLGVFGCRHYLHFIVATAKTQADEPNRDLNKIERKSHGLSALSSMYEIDETVSPEARLKTARLDWASLRSHTSSAKTLSLLYRGSNACGSHRHGRC
jgi:hypothetical protein